MLLRQGVKEALPNTQKQIQRGCQFEETEKYSPNERTEKTSEKELNKMEISKLSDAELKTLVIRILQEPSGYFDSIKKKTQAEMKVTLSERKKNLQGTTLEGIKTQIKSIIWNTRKKKAFNQNSMKKIEF